MVNNCYELVEKYLDLAEEKGMKERVYQDLLVKIKDPNEVQSLIYAIHETSKLGKKLNVENIEAQVTSYGETLPKQNSTRFSFLSMDSWLIGI